MADLLSARVTDGQGRPVPPRRITIWSREASARLADIMHRWILERTSRGEGGAGPLAAYDPDTTERRGDRGPATLSLTGRMLRTLQRIVTEKGASIQPTAEYARFVVFGTRHAPARDFLAIDDQLEEVLVAEASAQVKATAGGQRNLQGVLEGTAAEPAGGHLETVL